MTRARAVTASVACGALAVALTPAVVAAGLAITAWAAWQQRKTTTKGTK